MGLESVYEELLSDYMYSAKWLNWIIETNIIIWTVSQMYMLEK